MKRTPERPAAEPQPILIVGISAGGAASLPSALLDRIREADLLVGGRRHLGYFLEFDRERLVIGPDIEPAVRRLQQALARREQAVVLASGDPLCYGIGASLRRYFPPEALEIIPAPTAFQLAFAALAEPWSGAALLSAHARPLADVVAGTLSAAKAAILTDAQNTPNAVAQALLEASLDPDTPCAICENLGGPEQRIVRTSLSLVPHGTYAALNIFVIWPRKREPQTATGNPKPKPPYSPTPPGLPDDAFSTSVGQITKREIRLLSLAELALQPSERLWDIGAGSGAVGIEAARAQPAAAVYAIEKRIEFCDHIRENLRRFPAPNFYLTEGVAPDKISNWPAPNAVFIGGSGGRLKEIVKLAQQRLQPGGRLVVNQVALQHLYELQRLLPEAGVIQVQINRGAPILDMLRFEALNPVFIITWRKSNA